MLCASFEFAGGGTESTTLPRQRTQDSHPQFKAFRDTEATMPRFLNARRFPAVLAIACAIFLHAFPLSAEDADIVAQTRAAFLKMIDRPRVPLDAVTDADAAKDADRIHFTFMA